MVVAHRVEADNVATWVRQELNGYDSGSPLPSYRSLDTPVIGTFARPMRSFPQHPLTVVAPSLADWWTAELRMPLLEVQAYADEQRDNDPGREWPAAIVQAYEESGVFRLEFHTLFKARNVITRQKLRGLVDVVRNKALDFALELQSSDPDAGSLGGPTVEGNPDLQAAVIHVTNDIYGDGVSIATGSAIRQSAQVAKGDVEAFREAVAHVLAEVADVAHFVAAVEQERSHAGEGVQSFLDQVRKGAIKVAGGVGTNVAASMLMKLAKGFLGT